MQQLKPPAHAQSAVFAMDMTSEHRGAVQHRVAPHARNRRWASTE